MVLLFYLIPQRLRFHALTLNEKILVNNKLKDIDFDVGFLVYNNKNYPLFSELLNLLKVKSIDSSMSFSVANKVSNFELTSLYNTNVKIINNDLVKNDYTLINFFASWCYPCRKEHKYLLKLSRFLLTKDIPLLF